MPLAFNKRIAAGGVGDRKLIIGTVTFDASYLAGGEPFTPADIGLSRLDTVVVGGARSGHIIHWNGSFNAPTLVVKNGDAAGATAATEVANATNLATVVADFIAIGKG